LAFAVSPDGGRSDNARSRPTRSIRHAPRPSASTGVGRRCAHRTITAAHRGTPCRRGPAAVSRGAGSHYTLSNLPSVRLQKERRPEPGGRRWGRVRRGERDRPIGRTDRHTRSTGPGGSPLIVTPADRRQRQGPAALTTVYRPNGGVGTTVTSERSAPSIQGGRPRPACGPDNCFRGSGSHQPPPS
jgi:hypothetical protein